MVNYTCLLCNKEFTKKYNYNLHTRRITPCNKNNIDVILSNNNDIIDISQNILNVSLAEEIISQNILNVSLAKETISEKDKIKCEYCNKIFTFKNNLSRHLKKKV